MPDQISFSRLAIYQTRKKCYDHPNYKLHRHVEKDIANFNCFKWSKRAILLYIFFLLHGAVHHPTATWHCPWHQTMLRLRSTCCDISASLKSMCPDWNLPRHTNRWCSWDCCDRWRLCHAWCFIAAITLIHGEPLLIPRPHPPARILANSEDEQGDVKFASRNKVAQAFHELS